MAAAFSDEEFRLFSDWLAKEYGLRFGPEKRDILQARLEPIRAAHNLDSFERLLFRVRFHPDREAVLDRMLASLTNNESYFFREPNQLDLLRDEVLPRVARTARAEERPIRILSAGSASGEEPYTLLLVTRQALGPTTDVVVTGVDVDPEALARAREAVYRPHAFRAIDDQVRARHFREEEDGRWRLLPDLASAARFTQGNLVAPEWPGSLPPQDIVFCRNVLIYFDQPGLRRAVENLYRVARPGGYLFLGHAESLSRVPTRFVAERRPGAIFYTKPKGAE